MLYQLSHYRIAYGAKIRLFHETDSMCWEIFSQSPLTWQESEEYASRRLWKHIDNHHSPC